MVSLTRSGEIGCDECLSKMAEFAETTLAGGDLPEGLKKVEEHLALCGECEEEFRALIDALSKRE